MQRRHRDSPVSPVRRPGPTLLRSGAGDPEGVPEDADPATSADGKGRDRAAHRSPPSAAVADVGGSAGAHIGRGCRGIKPAGLTRYEFEERSGAVSSRPAPQDLQLGA
jgi:hypothetical protein